ncbi:hypothetical protein XENTR_v10014120 [Xenopus tropicalis]|nr:hypothetical protein XENTR_v10014120 [Xenopus tropicalis]
MSKMIFLCLGVTILTFVLPSQVISQNTTAAITTGNNTSMSTSNSSSLSSTSVTNTTTITTTTHSHASSVYAAPTLFLGFASVLLLNLFW